MGSQPTPCLTHIQTASLIPFLSLPLLLFFLLLLHLLFMRFLRMSRPILSLETPNWLLSLVTTTVGSQTHIIIHQSAISALQSFCFNASSRSKTNPKPSLPTYVCVGESEVSPFVHQRAYMSREHTAAPAQQTYMTVLFHPGTLCPVIGSELVWSAVSLSRML